MWEFQDFKILEQLLIPAISGGIGGLAVVVMASLNENFEKVEPSFLEKVGVCIKFLFLGGIAGIAAVNLLNPNGNISQVMVLGLIAGLSAYSYLERTALIDNIHKDVVFKKFKKKLVGNVEELVKKAEKEVARTRLNENDPDLNDGITEGIEVILKAKDDEIKDHVNNGMEEFTRKNPTATEDEIYEYYINLIQELNDGKET